MSIKRITALLKELARYALRQERVLEQLQQDVEHISSLLEEARDSRDTTKLVAHYESDAKAKQVLVERLERRINILANRLLRVAKQSKKEKATKLDEIIESLYRIKETLYHQLHRESKLFGQLDKHPRIVQSNIEAIIGRAKGRRKGSLYDFLAILVKAQKYAEQMDDLWARRGDEIPKDEYYGEKLGSEDRGEHAYHADCFSAKDRFEKDFKDIELPKVPLMRRLLRRAVILDAGCSVGYTTNAIAAHYPGAKVIGVDLNEGLLRKATTYFPRLTFQKADFYYLDRYFPKGYFTIIFMGNNMTYMLTHMSNQEMNLILARVLIVLREKGYLIIYGSSQGICILQKNGGKFTFVRGKKGVDIKDPKNFLKAIGHE